MYRALGQNSSHAAVTLAIAKQPGMNAIAVSRDLIKKGLTHGTKVRIKGLPGVYIVRDKMAARWKNKIDIYMGKDVTAALEWGMRHDIEIEYAENS